MSAAPIHLRDPGEAVLRVERLTVGYDTRNGRVRAVSDLSFDIARGETLGLIGESGCGKSTTGRAVAMLPPPADGEISLNGRELTALSPRELRASRHQVQMIFQDATASLNPRHSIRAAITRALAIQQRAPTAQRAELADEMLRRVGLDPDVLGDRLPHELSGGQCQRVAIARALVVEPAVVVCDEAVSALDASVQAQVLNLLRRLKAEHGHAMLFISHDLSAVRNISDRVAVMYLGTLCELAPADDLVAGPAHPYTALLVASVPGEGSATPDDYGDEAPDALRVPSGCVFRQRCPRASPACVEQAPGLTEIAPDHYVACHHPIDDAAG